MAMSDCFRELAWSPEKPSMSGEVEKAKSSSDPVRLWVRQMDRILSVKNRSMVLWTAVG